MRDEGAYTTHVPPTTECDIRRGSSMVHQYVVPVPVLLVPDPAQIDGAVANIIEAQNSQGGRFVGQIQAQYWEKPGCIGGLLGQKPLQRQRLLLVFEQIQ